MTVSWSFPTRVLFGTGSIQQLAAEVSALGRSRVLVVGDPGVEKAGLLDIVCDALEADTKIAVARFTDVASNPEESHIEAGVVAYRAHSADILVAVGGGSPIDTAKLIAVRVEVSRPFEELDDALGGDQYIPDTVPPVIAVPTTAGTGSEVGRAGVLTVTATRRKTVVFSPHILPKVALLDPELTRGLPPHITAATGFDALTHCYEAYVSKGDHPMADGIALRGIELVIGALETAVTDGTDMTARGDMMKAAMMGAVAFQKGLGACHSLAHPLSSECGLHHGLANALCLPVVVAFNESVAADAHRRVGALFGDQDVGGDDLATAMGKLRAKIGVTGTLKDHGVRRDQIETLADLALADICHGSNPRVCTREDFVAMYNTAY
ncbi:MAG: iron-containing alcohol dehydrogenase [Polyangiaceae bacterium]|nr:iron-containing alcohol dehydrogenase [Polyangiaceae bacterium]